MKRTQLAITLICAIGLIAACRNGGHAEVNDTLPGVEAVAGTAVKDSTASTAEAKYEGNEDVYLDGKQTEYVLILPSARWMDSTEHTLAGDSAALDDFYTGLDDMAWYYHLCSERLERMGVHYHETDEDHTVFCEGDMALSYTQHEAACGVLIVSPGGRFEFVDFVSFACDNDDE